MQDKFFNDEFDELVNVLKNLDIDWYGLSFSEYWALSENERTRRRCSYQLGEIKANWLRPFC